MLSTRSSLLLLLQGLAVDPKGQLFIADGTRIRRVDLEGNIHTVAGSSSSSSFGSVWAAAMRGCHWQTLAKEVQVKYWNVTRTS